MGTNKIICNSISFRSTTRTPDEIADMMGLSNCNWVCISMGNDSLGFQNRLQYKNIQIHFNPYAHKNTATMCKLSERGCVDFEQATTLPGGWNDLFAEFKTAEDLTLTKVGIVFEDHEHLLDGILDNIFTRDPWPPIPAVPEGINALAAKGTYRDIQEELYAVYGEHSDNIQIRLKQSQPRKLKSYFNGIGVELMLRCNLASEFIESSDNVGGFLARNLEEYFCGLYVPPYWDELMANMKQIERFSAEYNREEPAAN